MSSSGANLEKYRIPLVEINRVTRDFSKETQIGEGGFGNVYKGQLSEKWQKRTVAIKRLNKDGYQGNNEFQNELKMVSSFHHPNIITFVGYCDEANEMIIVYDYAENKSLDHHLQNPAKMLTLTWAQRLKICLGAAKGLNYLHSGLGEHNRVIHRDMKSANILLDVNLEAKICDFGLSRFSATNEEESQFLTKVAGTRFYMDPRYSERSRLTKESDVYSFGVVMFEMSSGTLVYHEKCFGDDDRPQYLKDVVGSYYDDGKKAGGLKKLIDPLIRDHIDMNSFHIFNKIAHQCLSMNIKERPTMAKIIRKIEQALNVQEQYESPSTITTRSLENLLILLDEIKLATQNFNRETSSDSDYRSQLLQWWEGPAKTIIRLDQNSYKSAQEFIKEVQTISSFQHQNISRFIGYCVEDNERILVHEYAVNGSVASFISHDKEKRHLTWAERLKIFLGVAKGLQYLHLAIGEDNDATRGNINSQNILLDETMEPKICFVGLSKLGPPRQYSNKHVSDLYSFGVLMFEILSGTQGSWGLERYVEPEEQMDLLRQYYRNDQLDRFLDGHIRDKAGSPCLKKLEGIAYRCIKIGKQRPVMRNTERQRGPGYGPPGGDKYQSASLTMDDVVEQIEDAMDFEGST